MRRISIALVITLGMAYPGLAMENGESALGDKRIISTRMSGGSAFLYDDRIIFTNGHTMFDKNGNPWPLSSFRVSSPGVKTFSQTEYAKVIKTFVAPGYEDWNPRKQWARQNDFGIMILDRPVANVDRAILATETQINLYREQGAMITTGGYGLQSAEDRNTDYSSSPRIVEPKKATLKMASIAEIDAAVALYKANRWFDANREPYPEDKKYLLLSPYGGPGTCDDDSGSGFFKVEKGKTIYLGTIGGHIGITNCGVDPTPIPGFTPMIGITPVFPYAALVAEAEAWVAANPAPTFVSTIKRDVPAFKANSSTLTTSQESWLKARASSALGISQVKCSGFYSTNSQKSLASRRAKAVCAYLTSLYSDWKPNIALVMTKDKKLIGNVNITLTE